MSWGSANEFFAMGGYALYVWGSYGVTLAVLAFESGALIGRERAIRKRLRRDAIRRGEAR